MWPLVRPLPYLGLISACINDNTLHPTYVVERTSMLIWHFATARHNLQTVPFPSGWTQDQKYRTLCPHLQSVKGNQPHRTLFIKLWDLCVKDAQQEAANKSNPWETYIIELGLCKIHTEFDTCKFILHFQCTKGWTKLRCNWNIRVSLTVTHVFRLLSLLFRSFLCQEQVLCPSPTSLVLSPCPIVLSIY